MEHRNEIVLYYRYNGMALGVVIPDILHSALSPCYSKDGLHFNKISRWICILTKSPSDSCTPGSLRSTARFVSYCPIHLNFRLFSGSARHPVDLVNKALVIPSFIPFAFLKNKPMQLMKVHPWGRYFSSVGLAAFLCKEELTTLWSSHWFYVPHTCTIYFHPLSSPRNMLSFPFNMWTLRSGVLR